MSYTIQTGNLEDLLRNVLASGIMLGDGNDPLVVLGGSTSSPNLVTLELKRQGLPDDISGRLALAKQFGFATGPQAPGEGQSWTDGTKFVSPNKNDETGFLGIDPGFWAPAGLLAAGIGATIAGLGAATLQAGPFVGTGEAVSGAFPVTQAELSTAATSYASAIPPGSGEILKTLSTASSAANTASSVAKVLNPRTPVAAAAPGATVNVFGQGGRWPSLIPLSSVPSLSADQAQPFGTVAAPAPEPSVFSATSAVIASLIAAVLLGLFAFTRTA